MTQQANTWERNIEGLRSSAQIKSAQTKQRAEEAITLLLKERRPINFKTVAQTAQISTAWLYANEEIKMRVIHLRSQQLPKAQIKIPSREQAAEIQELKKQLEAAYGPLYKR